MKKTKCWVCAKNAGQILIVGKQLFLLCDEHLQKVEDKFGKIKPPTIILSQVLTHSMQI